MIDLDEHIEVDDIPVCPLCDNAIEDWDEAITGAAHSSQFLVHLACVRHHGKSDPEEN